MYFLKDDSQDAKPTLPNLNNVEACLDSLDHYSRYKVNHIIITTYEN